MSELIRFGVSLEKPLLDRFDTMIRERQYTNRSEALRDLIRGALVQRTWGKGGEAKQVVPPLGPTIVTASKSQNETVERTEAPISINSDRATVPLQADDSSANGRTNSEPLTTASALQDSGDLAGGVTGSGKGARQGGGLSASVGSVQDSRGLTSGMKGGGEGERRGGDPLASASPHKEPGGSAGGMKGNGQGGTQGGESWAEGSENYNYIRDEIMKNIKYPDKARRLGIEGRVLLSFIVLENGTISEIRDPVQPGDRRADQAAERL